MFEDGETSLLKQAARHKNCESACVTENVAEIQEQILNLIESSLTTL